MAQPQVAPEAALAPKRPRGAVYRPVRDAGAHGLPRALSRPIGPRRKCCAPAGGISLPRSHLTHTCARRTTRLKDRGLSAPRSKSSACAKVRTGGSLSPPMPPFSHLASCGSGFPPRRQQFPDPTRLAAPPHLVLGQPGPFWEGGWCGVPLHGGTHGLVAWLGSWVKEGEAPI